MPNKKSAAKQARQSEKRRIRNRAKRSEMRTYIRTVSTATAEGDIEKAESSLPLAQARLDKAAKTNLIKKRAAQRKISRLARAISKAKTQNQETA